MYRAVIVDDEEPVLDSFSFTIGREDTGFEVCGTARTGTEAVSVIRNERPDLVFMDIQMPGIDGLEAIKRVRDQFPDTVFILATAYERFDIAQRAIPLGVFSYMVKPISRKNLLGKLEEVRKFLDRQMREKDSRLETDRLLEKTKSDKKERFLTSLIYKNPTEQEWREFSELFSIRNNRCAVYLIGTTKPLPDKRREEIYGGITRKLQYKMSCVSCSAGERLILLITEERNSASIDAAVRVLFTEYTETEFILGAGDFRPRQELNDSFSTAFLPFADAARSELNWQNEQESLKTVVRSALKSDRETAFRAFEEYWTARFNNDDFPVAIGRMIGLFTLLLRDIGSDILAGSSFRTDIAAEITSLQSVEEWQSWSSGTLNRLLDILEKHRTSSYPEPLIRAMGYIRENYSSPIQLSTTAEFCGVSASYLSRLFSEHLETTFIDHVNRFRLNEAMLLLNEKLSIKETSYLVGYQDPNYFSRIFRKYMGFAPSKLEKRRRADD